MGVVWYSCPKLRGKKYSHFVVYAFVDWLSLSSLFVANFSVDLGFEQGCLAKYNIKKTKRSILRKAPIVPSLGLYATSEDGDSRMATEEQMSTHGKIKQRMQ